MSLRAFLRTILQQKRIAESNALKDFLNEGVISLTEEDQADIKRRKEVDGVRIEEQKRFYEIARQRAAELDVYMENFRRDIVESSEFFIWLTYESRLVLIRYRWIDKTVC